MTFEVIPAIDLRGGRVVRLRRGEFEDETTYGDDPIVAAIQFANAGARWIHVVDLDGARWGRPAQVEVVRDVIAAVDGRVWVEVSGGLREASARQRRPDGGCLARRDRDRGAAGSRRSRPTS